MGDHIDDMKLLGPLKRVEFCDADTGVKGRLDVGDVIQPKSYSNEHFVPSRFFIPVHCQVDEHPAQGDLQKLEFFIGAKPAIDKEGVYAFDSNSRISQLAKALNDKLPKGGDVLVCARPNMDLSNIHAELAPEIIPGGGLLCHLDIDLSGMPSGNRPSREQLSTMICECVGQLQGAQQEDVAHTINFVQRAAEIKAKQQGGFSRGRSGMESAKPGSDGSAV